MRPHIVIIFLTGISILCSCANKVAPTGGEKDIEPPVLINAQPENQSVNFHAREIVLTFNEYVQLTDLQKQVLISPPLEELPEIEIRRKSILISVPDSLHPNTTYSVNFGNAITDFTEGNVLAGFTYVFSTGPEIDSLEIKGQVLDALTLKPIKNALIFLYPENVADSSVAVDLPLYYARASENGFFTAVNVHEGNYRVAAVDDQNNNLSADFSDEAFGIMNTVITAGDSAGLLILLNRQPPLKQQIKNVYRESPGKLVTVFARPVENFSWSFISGQPDSVLMQLNEGRDTIVLYGLPSVKDSVQMIWYEENIIIDTAMYRLQKPGQTLKADTVSKTTFTVFPANGNALPAETLPSITWNFPVISFNNSGLKAFKDSVEISVTPRFTDSLQSRISFEGNWQEGIYNLIILPGTVKDIYGYSNDSIKLSFSVSAENTAGSIALKLNGVQNEFYVVQLVNDKDELLRERIAEGKLDALFLKLDPGIYHLRVIVDQNRNNKWDGGNWSKNKWPETVIYYPDIITVRANWEVEINWNLPGK